MAPINTTGMSEMNWRSLYVNFPAKRPCRQGLDFQIARAGAGRKSVIFTLDPPGIQPAGAGGPGQTLNPKP